MPEEGIEPTCPEGHRILSPTRLPVPPLGHISIISRLSLAHPTRLYRQAVFWETRAPRLLVVLIQLRPVVLAVFQQLLDPFAKCCVLHGKDFLVT